MHAGSAGPLRDVAPDLSCAAVGPNRLLVALSLLALRSIVSVARKKGDSLLVSMLSGNRPAVALHRRQGRFFFERAQAPTWRFSGRARPSNLQTAASRFWFAELPRSNGA
jgi:hypothetical protein